MAELWIAANLDPDSRLPFLVRVPLAGGDLLFRTAGTWPREKALFAHPVPLADWPAEPVIVEQVALRSCHRRGAAAAAATSRQNTNAPENEADSPGPAGEGTEPDTTSVEVATVPEAPAADAAVETGSAVEADAAMKSDAAVEAAAAAPEAPAPHRASRHGRRGDSATQSKLHTDR